jgi:hypothetical protein
MCERKESYNHQLTIEEVLMLNLNRERHRQLAGSVLSQPVCAGRRRRNKTASNI